jgi:hypothetical protein
MGREMVNLNDKQGFHCKTVSIFKLPLMFIAFLLLIRNFVRQWGFKDTSFSVLVLNAKGGEIKAKAVGSTTI